MTSGIDCDAIRMCALVSRLAAELAAASLWGFFWRKVFVLDYILLLCIVIATVSE